LLTEFLGQFQENFLKWVIKRSLQWHLKLFKPNSKHEIPNSKQITIFQITNHKPKCHAQGVTFWFQPP
jgi:hypothetical protein